MAVIKGKAYTKTEAKKIAARERRRDKKKEFQFRVVKNIFEGPTWVIAMTKKGVK